MPRSRSSGASFETTRRPKQAELAQSLRLTGASSQRLANQVAEQISRDPDEALSISRDG